MRALRVNERTVLRSPRESDASQLFALVEANRSYLRSWLPWLDANRSVEDTLHFVRTSRQLEARDRAWNAVIEHDGELCGTAGFNLVDREAGRGELGYWIREDGQGRGIVTDCCRALIDLAFTGLALSRVTISTATENRRSQAVAERLGFRVSERRRDAEWLYDHYVDHVVYVMDRDRWPPEGGTAEAIPRDAVVVVDELVPYHRRLEERPIEDIDLIVVHCTELPSLAEARLYGERECYPSGTGNCGHYYVDLDGSIHRYVEDRRVAHHTRGYNRRSIGIELVHRGRHPNWYDSSCQDITEPYPRIQIAALVLLVVSLKERYGGLAWVAGHADLDRGTVPASDDPTLQVRRKVDPGSSFPWGHVLPQVGLARLVPGEP